MFLKNAMVITKSPPRMERSSTHENDVARAFSQMLECANRENSSETELREAVRKISEAWHYGFLEIAEGRRRPPP